MAKAADCKSATLRENVGSSSLPLPTDAGVSRVAQARDCGSRNTGSIPVLQIRKHSLNGKAPAWKAESTVKRGPGPNPGASSLEG